MIEKILDTYFMNKLMNRILSDIKQRYLLKFSVKKCKYTYNIYMNYVEETRKLVNPILIVKIEIDRAIPLTIDYINTISEIQNKIDKGE